MWFVGIPIESGGDDIVVRKVLITDLSIGRSDRGVVVLSPMSWSSTVEAQAVGEATLSFFRCDVLTVR